MGDGGKRASGLINPFQVSDVSGNAVTEPAVMKYVVLLSFKLLITRVTFFF